MASKERWCVEDLRKERQNCSFQPEELTHLIDGGPEKTATRREFELLFLSDPEYKQKVPQSFLDHASSYKEELRKACYTMQKVAREGKTYKELSASGILQSICKEGNPVGLHLVMFVPALMGQGTDEQIKQWLERSERGEIIGTYAQTELGHGTFLRGLETTATYNPTTEEFVLHSPTITASKWWPGGLGKTANYGVVMAQLYTGGECHGPHPFIVQLRDEDTHAALPGVTIGEIGPRLGLNTNDNGYLRFTHHHIPRTHMLMKHSQVLKDGTYVRPRHKKLAYGTMVLVRVGIVWLSCKNLQCATTIATRYSAVRRQSEMVPGELEPQVLDYQTQQYKLLPQIASVFALNFSASYVRDTYMAVTASINSGADLKLLPELHVLSSGLKALSASDSNEGIEVCRMACGGHGYLKSSSLPQLYCNNTASITYEGENTVLWLQVARSLVKAYRAGRDGQALSGSMAYLSTTSHAASSQHLTEEDLVDVFKVSAQGRVVEAEERLQRLCDAGQDFHHAWNNSSVLLVKAAQAHIRYFVCWQFLSSLQSLRVSEGSMKVLRQLLRLYLCYHLAYDPATALKTGFLTAGQLGAVEQDMCRLLALLRPQAVAIVDSFDLHEDTLNSTLGAWDGNVYQRLYDEAMKSPLNQVDVPEAYYKYLRPLMKSQL